MNEQTTADLIRQYGEPAFQAMLHQVALETTLLGWFACAMLLLAGILTLGSLELRRRLSCWSDGGCLLMACAGLLLIFGTSALCQWYLMTSNPIYYAIRGFLER